MRRRRWSSRCSPTTRSRCSPSISRRTGGAQVTVQVGEGAAQPYTEAVRFDAGQDLTVTVAFSSQNYYIENAAELGFVFDPDTWTYTLDAGSGHRGRLARARLCRARAGGCARRGRVRRHPPSSARTGMCSRAASPWRQVRASPRARSNTARRAKLHTRPSPRRASPALRPAETYEVRVAATETHFASDPVTLAVRQQYVVTLSAPRGHGGAG